MDDAATHEPLVAHVAVDVGLPHLDRPFDYRVPDQYRGAARAGVRVRVRFAGKLRDGFITGLSDRVEPGVTLLPLERVISDEVVLTPEIEALCRAVADHYAGTFSDVVRLAVPPRHAAAEAAAHPDFPAPGSPEPSSLPSYPGGQAFLDAVGQGRPLRGAWTPVPVSAPVGDWRAGLLDAAGAALASGRGALLLVPDAEALAALAEAAEASFGVGSFVTLSAELGPAARYRAFLAAARGDVRLVLGTRNAVYAPVASLGLIAVWDEGNDAYAEPRAPYPHAREVAALRASHQRCALLLAGYGRSAETQALAERGWLGPIALPPAEARRRAPSVKIASDTDWSIERDPAARSARLPHDAFATIRAGLASGPVLVQVPRAGYVAVAACQGCRTPASCPTCGGVLRGEKGPGGLVLTCASCGPLRRPWRCLVCGDTRLRAPRVGVKRTAEEIGRAFPGTAVLESWSGHLLDEVSDAPALVLATPGAEPGAVGGYAAAVLLDTWLLLGRPDLRAGEEALRRWLSVVALVRPAADGGRVLAVGETDARALQALVRLDPVGFARRELDDRAAAGFPPAAKLALVEGARPAVDAYAAAGRAVAGVQAFGPVDVDADLARLTLRAPLASGVELAAALKAESAARSQRKDAGGVRVRIDPQVID